MSNLKDNYLKNIRLKLSEELNVKNPLAVPRLEKITINIGLAEAKDEAGVLEKVAVYVSALSGQKPVVTYAKKSIAGFKLGQGDPVGMMVTLRGNRMYEFLDKLINVVLPKVRDFRGISETSFDQRGNYTLGLKEQLIFPEVDYKTIDKVRGLAVTITTNAANKEHGKRLLELLGMPFSRKA